MQAQREITVWADGSTSNHTYLLDGDRMIAYIPRTGTKAQYFKDPIRISLSGRKFERLAVNPFDVQVIERDPQEIQVQGSKGQTYTVNIKNKTCTCPGYTFRGACRHTKELNA